MKAIERYVLVATAAGLLLGLAAMSWMVYLSGGTVPTSAKPPVPVRSIEQIGKRSERGSLLGVQPWMEPFDYRDGLTFREKLRSYLKTAQDSGVLLRNGTAPAARIVRHLAKNGLTSSGAPLKRIP